MTGKVGQVDAAVRERLLTAALELFNTKGYASTSVREIVAAAGVTKPVLYYYFGSKEGIYLELMKGCHATFEEVVSRLATFQGKSSERVIQFCEGIFDGVVANLPVVRLIYAIYYGPPQGAPHFDFDQYFERMVEIVGAIVEEGTAKGELRQADVKVVTWAFIGTLNTAMEEQLCHKEPRISRETMVRILNLIVQGIAAA
ncbi:MAG: TetR family transcriptional [Geobacteraceae bacterium]|nr:MAG: TetR family transcriptional [Geobacteraceae bacterium]